MVKNLPPMQEMQETWVQFLGWKGHLEEEMATHSSILVWEIKRTKEPGRLHTVNGGHNKSDTTKHVCTHQINIDEFIPIIPILLKLFQKTEQEGGSIPKNIL